MTRTQADSYRIGYQLSDYRPVGGSHLTLFGAICALRASLHNARRGGDMQGIRIVRGDGRWLSAHDETTCAEWIARLA